MRMARIFLPSNRTVSRVNTSFLPVQVFSSSPLIEAGVDIVTISKRLGHASPNVTLAIYAHLFRKRDDKAAKAINDALAGFGKA